MGSIHDWRRVSGGRTGLGVLTAYRRWRSVVAVASSGWAAPLAVDDGSGQSRESPERSDGCRSACRDSWAAP